VETCSLSCSELRVGDQIEATVNGRIHFEGSITETMPDMDLFWALSPTGERRIIELSEYKVYRRATPEAGTR
jgi:hypothetical protein